MSDSLPLVSVIIPTFNRGQYICQAIDSALNQTVRSLEVIVVDDGSTDDSGDMILKKYGDAVIYRYQRNQGRSAARNAGMEMARGQYIAFLDSDDVWTREKLERQIPVFETSEDIGLVHTFSEVINADGSANQSESERRMKLYRTALKRGYTYLAMSQICLMFLSTVIVRRSLLKEMGPMDPSIPAFEDWDWYLRAALATKIATIPEPLALYRLHMENTGIDEFVEGRIRTSFKHLELIETSVPPDVRDAARCNFYIHLATAYYGKGDLIKCGNWMRKAINLYWPTMFRRNNFRYVLAMYFPRLTMALKRRRAIHRRQRHT